MTSPVPDGEAIDGASAPGDVPPPRIQVMVPVCEATKEFNLCMRSLAGHLPRHCAVYVLDDGPQGEGVLAACEAFKGIDLKLKYARSENNHGLVETCNWGFETFWERGNDLLLLDPRTIVTAGFLEEMLSVLHLHERHAVVTPRTNSPGFFSLSPSDDLSPSESYDLWMTVRDSLPRYQVVPTASCFCILIKSEVLERFGLFDGLYNPGYDQENDFVCRINRCGYSALTANRAFVFHRESSLSESGKGSLEASHRAILTERYPEFDRKISDYARLQVDPLESFAILYSPHKPRILYDLYHLLPQHSGTSDFALNLLREMEPLASKEYDFYVGGGRDQGFFASELRGHRLHDETASSPTCFDLVYKPCQMFRWHEFTRMTRQAPRVAFTLLDVIGVRCDYISDAARNILFRKTVELSDLVLTISEFSRSDFAAFYSLDVPMPVIHPGTDSQFALGENTPGEYVLIVGNALAHKGVSEAVKQLEGDWPIVVLGKDQISSQANVHWLASGKLSRRYIHDLLVRAKVVVYPSYYEGYGLPVADSIALGKPVIVLDTAVNREIGSVAGDQNLHRVRSSKDLRTVVERVWDEPLQAPNPRPRRWAEAAEEYLHAFRDILSRDIDADRLRRRWDAVRLLESLGLD